MGDISAEPSMEEILSSIKRIIAEEGEGVPPRTRRPQRAAPVAYEAPPRETEEVLELSEPMPERTPPPVERPVAERSAPAPQPQPIQAAPVPTPADPIVSHQAAAASRGSLDALTRAVAKPDTAAGGDGTIEGLVREMLRPMLREWLDAHLPELVEAMVAREIDRITAQR